MSDAPLTPATQPQSVPRRPPRTLLRAAGFSVAAIVVAFALVPLVWPVPGLENVADPRDLAGPDSRFAPIGDVTLHYRQAGSPLSPTSFVLLHGFGASTFSWEPQLDLLGDGGLVIALDRPAFGLTSRPLPGSWRGPNPYSVNANVEQTVGLMDELGIERAVLIGHSAGAVIAVETALAHPDRVSALILEAPAIDEARSLPSWASALLRSPQARRIGPLLVRRVAQPSSDDVIRSAYADPSSVSSETIAGYRRPLLARDWDRGLWELLAAPRPQRTARSLDDLTVPTLVVWGSEDTWVDPENSRRVAEAIPGAVAVEIEGAGHLPHEEEPERFAVEVFSFLDNHTDLDCSA